MNNIQKNTHNNTQLSIPDIETFKSLYYLLSGKRDTNIKIFKKSKRVSLSDIISLQEQVQAKLNNHHIVANITDINILCSKGKIKTFGFWEEFQKHNWDISETTESISITWDIMIKLPNYELPQRHTMKVRIASSIKPAEFFQIMTSSDDDVEYEEKTAFLICKIDFVNDIISNELINIVIEWHQKLEDIEPSGWFVSLLQKHHRNISRIAHYSLISMGLFLLYSLFKLQTSQLTITAFNKEIYINLYFWLILVLIVYFIFDLFGQALGTKIYSIINKIEEPPIFDLTKGDKNAVIIMKNKNNKLTTQFNIQFWLTIFGTVISLVLTKIVDYWIK